MLGSRYSIWSLCIGLHALQVQLVGFEVPKAAWPNRFVFSFRIVGRSSWNQFGWDYLQLLCAYGVLEQRKLLLSGEWLSVDWPSRTRAPSIRIYDGKVRRRLAEIRPTEIIMCLLGRERVHLVQLSSLFLFDQPKNVIGSWQLLTTLSWVDWLVVECHVEWEWLGFRSLIYLVVVSNEESLTLLKKFGRLTALQWFLGLAIFVFNEHHL